MSLLSGCTDNGPQCASREFSLADLKVNGNMLEESCDCSVTVKGAFLGLAHDIMEDQFFASVLSIAESVAKSHYWLLPSRVYGKSETVHAESAINRSYRLTVSLEPSTSVEKVCKLPNLYLLLIGCEVCISR